MGVYVAEYLGQRTDVDHPTIQPVPLHNADEDIPLCPFSSNHTCKKVKSHHEPICSVRKSDGTLWINCSDRLCMTKKDIPLCEHQQDILLQVGKAIFNPDIEQSSICVKQEEPLTVNDGTEYKADYIITLESGISSFSGPDRLVLEMQGGGETSNTGRLTSHITAWRNNPHRTNELLRTESNANTLETNAWRRQQEQFFVKGSIAMKTWKGYGMAFCVGTLLYDYIYGKIANALIPDLRDYNWTLAMLAFKEDDSQDVVPGPIPLVIDPDRQIYTNYQTFVQGLINQGEPSLDSFRGEFINLNNEVVDVP